jgi:hypothetical protein
MKQGPPKRAVVLLSIMSLTVIGGNDLPGRTVEVQLPIEIPAQCTGHRVKN